MKVYDRDGATHQLGELVRGKRSALIFIRHFCMFQYPVLPLKFSLCREESQLMNQGA